jgi:hypothetical protein
VAEAPVTRQEEASWAEERQQRRQRWALDWAGLLEKTFGVVAGRLNVAYDWTLGCIAVASDEAIREIAAWVSARRPGYIHIE